MAGRLSEGPHRVAEVREGLVTKREGYRWRDVSEGPHRVAEVREGLAAKREGYRWRDVSLRDLTESLR